MGPVPIPLGPPESVRETFTTVLAGLGAATGFDPTAAELGCVSALGVALTPDTGVAGMEPKRPRVIAAKATRTITAATRSPTLMG
jgi:hypothetical protein